MSEPRTENKVREETYVRDAIQWCRDHPEVIFARHQEGELFLAVHRDHGVVLAAEDLEKFEAKLNDRRPSVLRQLFTTCTALWVVGGQA